ncbi:MAG TPA: hypothetical protein VFU60_02010 [Ktedonobacterales bacterium]|nr:hypothetical protein [Ktedonobacterales bacterium]
MLSSDDILLGTAARYLLETGKEDAALELLKCALKLEEGDDDFDIVKQRRIILTAPSRVFELLNDDSQPVSIAVRTAINSAVPRAKVIDLIPLKIRVPIVVVVGFPDRNADSQAKLLQFARGADAPPPVLEMPSSRPQASKMLITPLSIFPVEQVTRDSRLCFIIMPFAQAFDDVASTIRGAVQAAGLIPLRGDNIQEAGHVLTQIWTGLLRARYVIADLSQTNGNVLYELGLAHAMGHEAILVTQDMQYVPFDLRAQRLILYAPTRAGLEKFGPELTAMLRQTSKSLP